MIMLSHPISRLTAQLVALVTLLGLALSGCSHNDHSDRQQTGMAHISYQFTQIMQIASKANLNADYVVLNAYDSAGNAVSTIQATQKIQEHANVTPDAALGATVWEGEAQVATSAVKLVLFYLDNAGHANGTSDVLDNVTISEGATFDFTASSGEPTESISWEPATAEQSLLVDESLTITATDSSAQKLSVALTTANPAVKVIGATVTGEAITGEGETAEVIATAQDSNGVVLDTKVYKFTITPNTITWDPVDTAQTLTVGEGKAITATDALGQALTVTLTASSAKVTPIDNTVYAVTATAEGETAEVTATAINHNNKIVDTKIYLFTVTPAPPEVVTWLPEGGNFLKQSGTSMTITAKNSSDQPLNVTLISASPALSIVDNVVRFQRSTSSEKPAIMIALARDEAGKTLDAQLYCFTIYIL